MLPWTMETLTHTTLLWMKVSSSRDGGRLDIRIVRSKTRLGIWIQVTRLRLLVPRVVRAK